MKIQFTDEEKIKYFDEIAKRFYDTNFGQISKADFELLMFHFYIETLIKANQKDGTLDYNACSDYKISHDLGITPQRVRTLKVKKQLIYPVKFNWQDALIGLTKFVRYDKATGLVALNIPDPNLYLAIQNYIEEEGGYIEVQLNSKLLKTRVEYYVQMLVSSSESEIRDIVKQIKETIKKEEQKYSVDDVPLGKLLMDSGLNISTILSNVISMAPIGSRIAEAFKFLL